MHYDVIEYADDGDKNPFREWFLRLEARAAAKARWKKHKAGR